MEAAIIEINTLGSQINMDDCFAEKTARQVTRERWVTSKNELYNVGTGEVPAKELDGYLDIPTYIRRGIVLSEG